MITLPVVLIAAAVLLLLLALLLGLFLQRRRTAGATLPGPRTVADLVQQRVDREPVPAPEPAEPVEPAVEESAGATPAAPLVSTVDATDATDVTGGADTESTDVEESSVPVSGPAPVTAARAIAPLGDDVPWRRAAQMSADADAEADAGPDPESEPSDVGRVPALALLRRPSRRPLPAEASDTEASDTEASDTEASDTESTGTELTHAGSTGVEPADGEAATSEQEGAEQEGAETAAEPADDATAEQSGAERSGAASTDAVPTHAASTADANEGSEGEGADDEPSGAALPLAAGGIAAGVIVAAGARAAVGRTDDHDAEPDGVDGDAARAEEPDGPAAGTVEPPVESSEAVDSREIDVRGVADRPDHSHVDLEPVDDGPSEVDGSAGALVSADSDRARDQDVPPAPLTDTVEPPVADQADEPAEAQVAPDHSGIEPAAALAPTRETPHTGPDGFPSTDPDVLFDSPPDTPAADEPPPDVAAAAAPAVEAPRTWATETPAPEISAAEVAVAAPEAQAAPTPLAVQPRTTEPTRRSPRDPAHLAAEQAAADLALLRTFGDPSARPERAPIVALEGTTRPESPRPVGAAQPVRFRAVRRDGTEVAGAAVALLDDRGQEVGTGRSATGELTAPYPGAYVLVATAPDHQPGAVALAVGDAPVDADVLLVRSAALVGVVTGEDGPLAGARVTLVQDGEVVDIAETDADGAYRVADLASGEYAVSVAAAGCDADVVLVLVADETGCVHDVELEPVGVPAG